MTTAINLPANCQTLTEEEMMYTEGGTVEFLGFTFESPLSALLTAGATVVAAVAGFKVLSNVWDNLIQPAMDDAGISL